MVEGLAYVSEQPALHAWHHTRQGHLFDGNYGNTMLVWDRLFGSEVTQPELPESFGIGADQALMGTREHTLSPLRMGRAVVGMQLLRPRMVDDHQ